MRSVAHVAFWFAVFGLLFICVLIFAAVDMSRSCLRYANVTGVKSASAGGFLSEDVCVYETTAGDVVRSCTYNEGDQIAMGTRESDCS